MTPQMKGALVAVLVTSPMTAVMAATLGPAMLSPAMAVLLLAVVRGRKEER